MLSLSKKNWEPPISPKGGLGDLNGVNLIDINIDPGCSEYFEEFVPNTSFSENFKNPVELINKVKPMVMEILNNITSD